MTYLDKPFAVRPPDEVEEDVVGLPESVKRHTRRVFLADGDALALSRRRLLEILELLRRELPSLERVSCYANAQNLLKKSVDDLRAIRAGGLELLYLGLESGDDETLADIHKGVTAAQQIEACRKAKEAGLALSVTAILGLAGTGAVARARPRHRRGALGDRPRVHRRAQSHGRTRHAHGGARAQRRVRRARSARDAARAARDRSPTPR